MLYNNDKKAWEPAEGIRGMSYVQVYHHDGNNSYRIVGRSMTDQQVVVINCAIVQNLKYNAATPTFHQWRDQRQVYGLNFHSKDDAGQFKAAIDDALESLNTVPQPKTTTTTQQYVPQTPQNWKNRYTSQNSEQGAGDDAPTQSAEATVNQEPANVEKPKVVSSSVNITPAAPAPPSVPAVPQAPPTPPAAPSVPAIPAPPPAPPGGGGGVPAPPPPPPPPPAGGGGGGGGGSLAAQIAAAKLKKAESKPEPKQGGGSSGAFGGDMMAEMQRKLAARKAKDGEEPAAPKTQVETRNDRLPSVNKMPVVKSNHVAPPVVTSAPSKQPTIRQERTPNNESTATSSGQLQELKADILAEFRKELDIAKADIIQAIRQELSKTR